MIVESWDQQGGRGFFWKSLGDQQDSCEVSRKRIGTSRICLQALD